MIPCHNGAACNFPGCKFAHPQQHQFQPQPIGWHYCPMYNPNIYMMPPGQPQFHSPYQWGFCPAYTHNQPQQDSHQQAMQGCLQQQPPVQIYRGQFVPEQQEQQLLTGERRCGRGKHHGDHHERHEKHGRGHGHGHFKHNKHRFGKHCQRDEGFEGLAKQFSEAKLSEPILESGFHEQLRQLKEMGFEKFPEVNRALLRYFQGNIESVIQILPGMYDRLNEAQEDPDFEDDYELLNSFIVLKELGFRQFFRWHKLIKVLYRFKNNLEEALQHLTKKREIKLKQEQFRKKVAMIDKKFAEHIEEEIPQGCEFLVDGFNIIPTNKHLRKLFFSHNHRDSTQAVMRLKILVETLAEGHLVLDKQFLPDLEQQEIYGNIGVSINRPKLIREVVASPKSADDVIVELITAMPEERQRNILLVTADHELIQRCLIATNGRCKLMNGKRFIKLAKKMHDFGIRKRILIRKEW